MRKLFTLLLLFSFGFSQELKVGDVAPSWALMYSPGKFEMLRTWAVEPGERLKRPVSQPYRHVVVMSFFATCLLYTSPSPRDVEESRMPSSA